MKTRTKLTAFCFVLLGVWLTSCTTEKLIPADNGQEVVIRIAPTTRGGSGWPDTPPAGVTEEDKSDYSDIGSLRMLGFHSASGKLIFNESVFDDVSGNANGEDYTIEVKTGNYTIIYVANEHLDPDLADKLDENENHIPTLAHFKYLSFGLDAFDEDSPYMPMVKVYANVSISKTDDDDSFVSSSDPDFVFTGGQWKVALERLGVKVRLTINIPTIHKTDFEATDCEVYFNNIPSKVFLYPNRDNSGDYLATDFVRTVVHSGNTSEHTIYRYGTGVNPTIIEKRIILPESYFDNANDDSKAIELVLETNQIRRGVIGIDMGNDDYTIPRNNFLNVTATVSAVSAEQDIDFTIKIEDWGKTDMEHEIE